jgi:hypothetical protein
MNPHYTTTAYLSWTDLSGTYQSLVFDVIVDETWTGGADVTKRPVESGPNISDNIRVRLRKCTLKVTATNEPVRGNQWTDAAMQSTPVMLANQQAIAVAAGLGVGTVSIAPGAGVVDVAEWDSKLKLRILAASAGGLLGGAIGGQAGGAIGALAVGAIAGALLTDKTIQDSVHTNAKGQPPMVRNQSVSAALLTFATNDDFVLKTIELLEQLCATGQTIDVWGTKSTCVAPGASSGAGASSGLGAMAIAELTHSRNQGTGTGADITIGLEEIRIVYTATVPAPKPTAPDSTASVSKGNQGTFNMEDDANAQNAADANSPFVQGENAGSADAASVLTN